MTEAEQARIYDAIKDVSHDLSQEREYMRDWRERTTRDIAGLSTQVATINSDSIVKTLAEHERHISERVGADKRDKVLLGIFCTFVTIMSTLSAWVSFKH